jgi:uncharacterized membrane protein
VLDNLSNSPGTLNLKGSRIQAKYELRRIDDGKGKRVNEVKPRLTMPKSMRVSMAAMLSAVAISLSYARFWASNIEFTSLTIFLSGFMLGSRTGVLVGLVTESVFSSLNPLGSAPPPIFLAQIGCMMLIGAAGGLYGRLTDQSDMKLNSSIKMAAMGLYLTIVFDLVTNLGFAISFYGGNYEFALILGSPFMIVHVVSNTLIFGTIGPVLSHYMVRVIEKAGCTGG